MPLPVISIAKKHVISFLAEVNFGFDERQKFVEDEIDLTTITLMTLVHFLFTCGERLNGDYSNLIGSV